MFTKLANDSKIYALSVRVLSKINQYIKKSLQKFLLPANLKKIYIFII
jgi:hypothetical protein